MRVLYVTQGFWPYMGGMETIGERLVTGLRRDGFDVAVLTGREDARLADRDERAGVPIHRLDWGAALVSRDAERLAAVRQEAAAIGREWNPDIVHLGYSPAWGALALGARLDRIAPLIMTFHGTWSPFWQGGPTVTRRVLDAAGWVTACSHDALESIRAFEPAITSRSSAIANGLDSPSPLVALPRDGPQFVVAAGRLSPEKGYDVLLRALALARRKVPDVRLLLAGRGREEGGLMALARDLGIDEAVDLGGWVARDEMASLFDRATVVAVPSRQEGFGLTALEAALRARPVVASRVGGLPEVVEDGVTGILVAPEDHEALAGELVALLQDPERAARLGRAARERAELQFSEERHLRAHEALYLQVASRQETGPAVREADRVAR